MCGANNKTYHNNPLIFIIIVTFLLISKAWAVSGAVYTTFDATQGGCLDSPNGVNCNNYTSKADVYTTGGPKSGNSGLGAGDYYFTVLVPGTQNGGFIEGANGNLSDAFVGGTAGDSGSGDSIANRTFHVDASGNISSYAGNHPSAIPGSSNYDPSLVSPQGNLLILLMPFDDTSNAGGVYILSVCKVGATSPNDCKFDAFRIEPPGGEGNPGKVSGLKYYDVNTNGIWDNNEVGIPNWPITYADSTPTLFNVLTDSNGAFSVTVSPDTYLFAEVQGALPWMQTGNTANQSSVAGSGSVVLNGDKTYTVTVAADDDITGINFGNVCIGKGGSKPPKYWCSLSTHTCYGSKYYQNNNSNFTYNDNVLLTNLNLRYPNGTHFNPLNYMSFKSWLCFACYTKNMAYFLSTQLAVMALNVNHGYVNGSALIYAPATTSANANGFATVNDIMAEANALLGLYGIVLPGHPEYAHMKALMNALKNANFNTTFVQPNPSKCPAPPEAQ